MLRCPVENDRPIDPQTQKDCDWVAIYRHSEDEPGLGQAAAGPDLVLLKPTEGLAPQALLELALLENESGDCCDCPILSADKGRVPVPPEVGRAPLPPEVGRGMFPGPPQRRSSTDTAAAACRCCTCFWSPRPTAPRWRRCLCRGPPCVDAGWW